MLKNKIRQNVCLIKSENNLQMHKKKTIYDDFKTPHQCLN